MSRIAALLLEPDKKESFNDFADFKILTVCGKTLAERYIEILLKLGIERVYLFSHSEALSVKSTSNVKVIRSLSEVDAHCDLVVIPLDVFVPYDALSVLVNYHLSLEPPLTLLVAPCENARDMLSPLVDTSTGRVTSLVKIQEDRPDLVFTGIFVVSSEYVSKLLQNIAENLPKLIGDGILCEKSHWTGHWCRIDTPWDLLNLGRIILETEFESGVYIHPRAKISHRALIEPKDGPVIIDEEAVIDHDAIVRGPVYIGKKTYIGNNALVRNYTIVESNCMIGSSVDITESIVLSNSTIGRGAYISCSIIGPNTIIDPGVVTYSVKPEAAIRRTPRGKVVEKQGAVIGEGCRIGAYTVIKPGTLVRKGMTIEPLSKV